MILKLHEDGTVLAFLRADELFTPRKRDNALEYARRTESKRVVVYDTEESEHVLLETIEVGPLLRGT